MNFYGLTLYIYLRMCVCVCVYFSAALTCYSYSYSYCYIHKTNIDNTRIMHTPHGVSHMISQRRCFGFSRHTPRQNDSTKTSHQTYHAICQSCTRKAPTRNTLDDPIEQKASGATRALGVHRNGGAVWQADCATQRII